MSRSASGSSDTAVIAALAFAGVVVAVMQTLMVPLLAELPTLLHSSRSNAAWVLTVTLLTAAVATPVLGRLGDMFGKRRMLLIAVALLVVGSIVCGLTSSLLPMIVGRALQGGSIGAIPLGISIMRDELPAERLGSAVGLMSSSLGIGGALALPAAALVAEHLDWHTLFFGAAALGVVSLILVLVVVPESSVRTPGRFDFRGAIGLSIGLVALLLGISKGGDWGWSSSMTLGCFGVALVVFLLWGWMELRTAEPLVDLRTTARRQVLLTNLASILVGFALYATQLVPPQLLQLPTSTGYGLGQSMVIAGLCVAPSGVFMMLMSPVGARVIAGRGPKVSFLCGIVVLGIAYAAGLALLSAAWQIVVFSSIAGIGVGLAYSSMPALIIGAVPSSETASANGLNTLMRSIGTSSSSAVVGMVLAHMTTSFGPVSVPSMAGFRTTFLIGCAACVVALVIVVFIPGRSRAAAPAEPGVPQALPGNGVSGRVRDAQGAAVAGATCTLIDQSGRRLAQAMSDEAGRYRLDGAGDGEFVLICAVPGCRPEAASVTLAGTLVQLNLTLPGGAGLTGTVRTTDGTVVPGALVVAADARGVVAGSANSGADGMFTLAELASGRYVLAARAEGHRPAAEWVDVADGVGVHRDLAIARTGSAVGGTVCAPNGSPVGDARVVLLDPDGNLVATGITGVDGRYRFADLPAGRYAVVVSGYAPVSTPVSLTGGGRHQFDLSLGHEAQPDRWARPSA